MVMFKVLFDTKALDVGIDKTQQDLLRFRSINRGHGINPFPRDTLQSVSTRHRELQQEAEGVIASAMSERSHYFS